ncbi:hypothetical protein ACIP9X_19400 [Arthrobacter sp. NPDC093125]|uniref:hypothetical protein n=1 Tax=Arthrobacter sp. NPDC093125 TaxID=3363944 RepID=UPI0038009BFA
MSQSGTEANTPAVRRVAPQPEAGHERSLTFPIRLRCDSRDLVAAEGLDDAVAGALGRAFDRARKALPAADVVGGGVILHPPHLAKGEVAPDDWAKLVSRLTEAIQQAARSQSLPLGSAVATSPASAPTAPRRAAAHLTAVSVQTESWKIRIAVDFRITPRRFFEIRAQFARNLRDASAAPIDPMDLYFPILDELARATAWVTEVRSEREFTGLAAEVQGRFGVTRKSPEFVWAIHGWGALRELIAQADRDHRVATRIPDFTLRGFSEERPGPARGDIQTILRPGAWALSVFLPLPNLTIGGVVELGDVHGVDVPLRDVVALGTAEDFAREAGLDRAAALRTAPDVPVRVAVTPFTVRRPTHERSLAALFAGYRRDMFLVRMGAVVPYTDPRVAGLGSTLGPFVASLAAANPGRGRGPAAGFWPPGAAGANLTPLLGSLRQQILRTANAGFIAAEAETVHVILRKENSAWLGMDRNHALLDFIARWSRKFNSDLFALLLEELNHRGTLDAFVAAVRALPSTYTAYKRMIVKLADGDARFSDVVHDIERLARGVLDGYYDVANQEVWLLRDPERKVRAANGSSDHKTGVVAEVDSYYSEYGRVLQPKPEILDRLREPTRKKVSELLARMICKPGERMTREELLQRATQEAAKELPPLTEDDLVKVTLVKSIRVLKLEQRREAGVDEIYVHYQPVQKVGDNPWVPAGDVIVGLPSAFEAYLTSYHVKHLERALTIFVMAQTVVIGGVMIIELGVATLGQLFFFVGMQVLIYHFTTDVDDRSIEGYLGAALKGELDAVGFKVLSGAVKQLGGFAAGRLVTRNLVSEVATKWLVYGLRGFTSATGAGAMEAAYQFGEDLLHYSHCQGWSKPEKYWDRFKMGFAVTLAFEFLAVPILAPPIRLALEKASTAVEAARALLGTGKSLRELTALLLKGAEGVESAIAQNVQHPAGQAITRGFRQQVTGVLKALGKEYESRAYQSLLELYGTELTGAAADGLKRLLRLGNVRQVDALLQRALETRRPLRDVLGVLNRTQEPLLAEIAQAGRLAELATLEEASLALLEQLQGAKVNIRALLDGSGKTLREFGDEFAKLSEAQRAAALEKAAGRSPAQVLEEAQAAAKPPEPLPVAPEPATLDEIVQALATSKGFTKDDLRAFMGTRQKLSAVLARQVARLLEHYTPEEVRAFGEFLAKHRTDLNDRAVEELLEHVPKGKLRERIAELEEMLSGDDAPLGVYSEKELATTEGVTIDKVKRKPPRLDEDGLEEPLRDVVETAGSKALRASLIARDGLPSPGSHAHHIVPENDFQPGLDWLRERLAQAGCGINEASNGVFLAGSWKTANPELTRLHLSYIHAGKKKEYAYTLTRRLYGKRGAALVEEIEKIGREMAGTEAEMFKILEIPHGWRAKWEPGMTAPADPAVKPEWIE